VPKAIKIDVPKCYCPHCGQEVGPATGIHWTDRKLRADEPLPRNIEQCAELTKASRREG